MTCNYDMVTCDESSPCAYCQRDALRDQLSEAARQYREHLEAVGKEYDANVKELKAENDRLKEALETMAGEKIDLNIRVTRLENERDRLKGWLERMMEATARHISVYGGMMCHDVGLCKVASQIRREMEEGKVPDPVPDHKTLLRRWPMGPRREGG
jgi:hypothetical protein